MNASHPLFVQAQRLAADQQLYEFENDTLQAHASLWWNDVPRHNIETEKIGVIGHFFAIDVPTGARLLARCCDVLRQNGCTLALGPMDKNTWYSYRYVTWRDERVPPFYLEPNQPQLFLDCFLQVGFIQHESYISMLDNQLTRDEPRYERVKKRFVANGFVVRPFQKSKFEAELQAIYDISVESFKHNAFYAPLDKETFFALYSPFKDAIIEPLNLIAEHEGKAAGFVFCVPNFTEPNTKTFVVKTIAVLPDRQYAGLGAVLIGEVRERARAIGFERAIFALIHKSNISLALGKKFDAAIIREYALFAKDLR